MALTRKRNVSHHNIFASLDITKIIKSSIQGNEYQQDYKCHNTNDLTIATSPIVIIKITYSFLISLTEQTAKHHNGK